MVSRDTTLRCASEEAHGPRLPGQPVQRHGIGDIVPCHALLDVIAGHAGIVQRHLHRSRGVRHGLHHAVQPLVAEALQNLHAQLVLAHGAYYPAVQPELGYMVCKVGGCPAQFLSFGQHVP